MPIIPAEERPATPRQLQVLAFIRRFLRQHARPPTLRRVAAEVGLSSPYSVMGILNALVRKGMLRRVGGRGEWCTYLPMVPPGHCPCCEQPLPREGREADADHDHAHRPGHGARRGAGPALGRHDR